MLGFVDYNLHAVVKVGGSLLRDRPTVERIHRCFEQISNAGKRVLLVPGGGPTDNTIESIDVWAAFPPEIHHQACALAQDQTAIMLSSSSFGDYLVPCRSMREAMLTLSRGKVPVIMPSGFIELLEPFEMTWTITSDSMAAWFGWVLRCKTVIVLTDVDGVYENYDSQTSTNRLLDRICVRDLKKMGPTAVDACFAGFLEGTGIDAWVLNGAHPDRLVSLLLSQAEPIGTRISNGETP